MGRQVTIAAALAAALLGGCGGSDIRVSNDTSYAIEGVVITTPSNAESFGNLAPGALTDYRTFDEAYEIAGATFVASGYRFDITPLDYVGEEELGSGEFTYHLAIENFGQGMAYLFTTED